MSSRAAIFARESAALVIGSCLTLAVTGYQFGRSNHLVYLPDPLHRFDPSLLANDWFTTQTLQYHSAFGLLTHLLLELDLLQPGFLVGYLATVLALHGAWRLLVAQIGGSRESYLLSVILVQLCAGGVSLGAYHFLQDSSFLPSNVAAVLMLWSICALAARRWVLAGLFLGAAGLLHLNYAVAACIIWVCLSAWQRPFARAGEARSWLVGSLAAAILTALNVLPAVSRLTSPPGMPFSDFVEIYARLRHPHHYDPLSWHPSLWLCFLIPVTAAAVISFKRRKDFLRPAPKIVFRLAAILLGLLAVALAFAGITFVSERLVQLSLFRFSIFVSLLACVVICWWAWDYTPRQWPIKLALASLVPLMVIVPRLVAAFLPGSVAANFVADHWPTLNYIVVVAALLVLVVMLGTRLPPLGHASLAMFLILSVIAGWERWVGASFVPDDSPAYRQTVAWVRHNTDPNAIFLVPPAEQSMRVDGLRAVVVNFKAVPQLSAELAEWRHRMEAVVGVDLKSLQRPMPATLRHLDTLYNSRSTTDLISTARRYNARYVITATRKPGLGQPINPASQQFFVYDLATDGPSNSMQPDSKP